MRQSSTIQLTKLKRHLHSTAAGAARTALKCNADNLILTHFSARLRDVSQAIEEARQVLGKTYGLEAASDGDRVRIDENGHASFAQVISEWLGATQTIASLKEYVVKGRLCIQGKPSQFSHSCFVFHSCPLFRAHLGEQYRRVVQNQDQHFLRKYPLMTESALNCRLSSSLRQATSAPINFIEGPLSISEKSWTIIVDNLAHDGDRRNGDQGGGVGRVSIKITKLSDGQWTSYHDLVGIIPDGYLTLLEGDDLRLEEGTAVSVTAWSLEGFGDVYLQSESMNANYLSGQSNVAITGAASLLGVDGTASFNWIVPAAFADQPLKLVVDNTDDTDGQGIGSTTLRVTIRVELTPVMKALFVAENNSVALNTPLNFDGSSSPNNLGQIDLYEWDFDASVDSDNDGDAINDADAVGITASSSWSVPGEKTVTLTVSSTLGLDRLQSNITVLDETKPCCENYQFTNLNSDLNSRRMASRTR